MKIAVLAAATSLLVIACSSSDDGANCTIAGTWSVESQQESGTCPDLGSDTYTITASGGQYEIEFAGVRGFCDAQPSGTCGLQAKCDAIAQDAVEPGARATIQYALTFEASRFTGTVTIAVPKTTAADACTSTYRLTGIRR